MNCHKWDNQTAISFRHWGCYWAHGAWEIMLLPSNMNKDWWDLLELIWNHIIWSKNLQPPNTTFSSSGERGTNPFSRHLQEGVVMAEVVINWQYHFQGYLLADIMLSNILVTQYSKYCMWNPKFQLWYWWNPTSCHEGWHMLLGRTEILSLECHLQGSDGQHILRECGTTV